MKRRILILILTMLMALPLWGEVQIVKHDGCTYYLLSGLVTLKRAKEKAKERGGRLVRVDTHDKMKWLSSTFDLSFGAWTDGRRKSMKDHWKWGDHSLVNRSQMSLRPPVSQGKYAVYANTNALILKDGVLQDVGSLDYFGCLIERQEKLRWWEDKIGRKVLGRLVSVSNGYAIIKTRSGELGKVLISRLKKDNSDYVLRWDKKEKQEREQIAKQTRERLAAEKRERLAAKKRAEEKKKRLAEEQAARERAARAKQEEKARKTREAQIAAQARYQGWVKKYGKHKASLISKGSIFVGMKSEDIHHAWGYPDSINKTTNRWGTSEQWVYGLRYYVYVSNGIVTSFQH